MLMHGQAEAERLDEFHVVLYGFARNQELHRAPITPSRDDSPPIRILDVGCAGGNWAIEMAEYVMRFMVSANF